VIPSSTRFETIAPAIIREWHSPPNLPPRVRSDAEQLPVDSKVPVSRCGLLVGGGCHRAPEKGFGRLVMVIFSPPAHGRGTQLATSEATSEARTRPIPHRGLPRIERVRSIPPEELCRVSPNPVEGSDAGRRGREGHGQTTSSRWERGPVRTGRISDVFTQRLPRHEPTPSVVQTEIESLSRAFR
jgi:hypothetical protein